MRALVTRGRLTRLAGYASTQVAVQAIGFASGIVLVRHLEPAQYGYYTLAIGLTGVVNVLAELGIATAVLSIGGRLAGRPARLAPLMADAQSLQRKLAALALCVALPISVGLTLHQNAPAWQAVILAVLCGACAVLNVRNGMALAVARLAGDLAFQQKIDLAANAGKLVLLMLAGLVLLDATVACALNLGVALTSFVLLRRDLGRRLGPPVASTGEHLAALRSFVSRQAPNSIYYVLSSQLAVWLVGLFGTAERVAEVGALGRLGAVFAVISAVMVAVVQPYFARQHGAAELGGGFAALNLFFAALALLLVALAVVFPDPILWVLGRHYDRLQAALPWMVLAASLSAWSGALYAVGSARGWVLPVGWSIGGGLATLLAALRWFDVSTVRGSFMLNTMTAFVSMAVTLVYVASKLQRHRAGSLVT